PPVLPTVNFSAFDVWSASYLAAPTPQAKAALLAQGEQLAQARREGMARLIKSDPEHALALALPYGLRKQLPASINSLLEERVSGRGDYSVIYYTPLPGRESEVPPTEHRVELNHQTYEAYVYGRRLQQSGAQSGISLNGVAIDNYLALSADPIRILSPEEAADAVAARRAKSDAPCVVCGQKPAAGGAPILLDLGGKLLNVCQASEAAVLNKQLSAAESKLPPEVQVARKQAPR